MFDKFLKANEKAGLYSVYRINAKSSDVCSKYNDEIISKLNESQENLNRLWILGLCVFLIAAFTFLLIMDRCFNRNKKNQLV